MAINIERFISNVCCNSCQSFYDLYVETNVRFRSKLGMKAFIIRRQLGNCCDWCANLAGIYDPSDAPDDIYRRHSNCRCLVTYKTEKGYQDVWNKKIFKKQKQARYEKLKELSDKQRKIATVIKSEYVDTEVGPVPFSKNKVLAHNDVLYERFEKVPKLEGYDDIFVHGDEYGFSYYDLNGNDIVLSIRELADILLKYGKFENDKIRLCSCRTGAPNAISAQKLADYLGKKVLAPTKILWTYPEKNGLCDMIIADDDGFGNSDLNSLGEWKTFKPRK